MSQHSSIETNLPTTTGTLVADETGRLTTTLDSKRMTDFGQLAGKRLDWLECVADEGRPLTGGSTKTIERLTALGVQVTAQGVVAPPVWNLHKKAGAPALIDATSALFTS